MIETSRIGRAGAVALLLALLSPVSPEAQQPDEAAALVNSAAEALGGRSEILGLRTLTMIGYGEMIDGFGLSNISGSRYAPQKLNNLLEFERSFDLVNQRMRTRVRRRTNFTFAAAGQNLGINRANEVLDGQVAYNVNASGTVGPVGAAAALERRLRMFSHPITAVRAALDPATRLTNLHREDNIAVVNVATAQGDEFALGIHPDTRLPAWVRWLIPHTNFGEVTYQVHFTAYMPVQGIELPMGYRTIQDFRDMTQEWLYIDRNIVNAPIDDMQAPASVRGAAPGGPQGARGGGPGGGGAATQEALPVADGVWRFNNGTAVFEFDDHMTLFEVHGSEAAVLDRIARASQLVPGKPVTQAIISHHHDDHASGLRAAVSQGLTIIAHYSLEDLFREQTERLTTRYHDALGRDWKPMTFVGVRDHLKLQDARNEVDLYHVIANNHMATGVMAHVPRHRLLVEADLTTRGWDYQWWGGSLLDNIEHRRIQVDQVAPVHGRIEPLADVVAEIERQVEGARALCAKASAAQLFQPGCPVQYTRENRAP